MTNKEDLEAFVDESNRRCRERGYYPTEFQQMRDRYGTVVAIKRLVQSGDLQSGFLKLKTLNLLDWSLEAAVIKFPGLFDEMTREYAGFRLAQARGRKLKEKAR